MRIDWSCEKNDWLKSHRDISFEDIVIAISDNRILDILEHPNQEKYPGQKMFIIFANNYIYQVPFVENNDEIFLKTIIPNRKLIKKYFS